MPTCRNNRHIGFAIVLVLVVLTMAACSFDSTDDRETWQFVTYGVNADAGKVSCTGGYDAAAITIKNSGSGKMVPYGADGLAFYYTRLNAQEDNFVLSATVLVDAWTMTNGEDDGFGLMVCDAVAGNGGSTNFWNNCYMAAITKVEYEWNPKTQAVSNVGDHIVMRQGIAAREKIGSPVSYPEDSMRAAALQTVTSCTLESSQGGKGEGTYNIIGNYTPIIAAGGEEYAPAGTVEEGERLTAIKLEIQRDNTGYRIRYIEEDGAVHEKLFYDTERTHLSAIDPENIYVGFFVTSQACVTFQDMNLARTKAEKDPAPEDRAPEVTDPDFKVTSSSTANTENYDLVFETNYAGILNVTDERGERIAEDVELGANESVSFPCTLHLGENPYEISFAPSTEENERIVLSDSSTVVFQHCVSYRKIGDGRGNIYTSSDSGDGDGTEENPIRLTEAVKYAAPGQTILLGEGVYTMSEPLDIERGHDGTELAPIALLSDPRNQTRPVLDFQRQSAGIILSADHWYFYGFDCTGSASNEYGIHLTGNFNTLERLEIYRNGNTGLHISSLSLWDDTAQWPHDNYILNCTSYGNCDDAYEDADGFACQFTAGPGNVFDGCIAHHNADDGWDLYAKVWLAPLGPVTIRNCIAYKNGYLEDGTEAGDGNGFKLGGDGMPGGHVVENCLSFENKASGFTSNTCPDVTLRDCTAIDNGRYNINLSSIEQKSTAYVLENTCSLRTETSPGMQDKLQGGGTQLESALRNETVYAWDAEKKMAVNRAGDAITAQKLYVSTAFVEGYSISRAHDGGIVLRGDYLLALDTAPLGVCFEREPVV